MRPSTIVVLAALSVAGCSGGCSGPSEDPPATASAQRTEASGGEATAAPVDPGPPPVLRIAGAVDDYDRSVAIRVENRGDEQVELSAALTLERKDGDEWEAVEGALAMRDSCEGEPPECVTLAPGAVYIPLEWPATIAPTQCVCTRCGPAEAGTYRLVAKSCNGAHEVDGEPFALP